MLKFDDVLKLKGDGDVEASGPVDSGKEVIVDLCAWVFQRDDKDAAATEMTVEGHHMRGEGELKITGNHWSMELMKVGDGESLKAGNAFGVAVAMIKENGKERVLWWGHPLTLED